MSSIYISDIERRKLATLWVKITLFCLHVWASLLLWAVLGDENKNGAVIGGMFSTVTFGIGATLLILLVDRAADSIIARFALPTAPVTETTTHTITTEVSPDSTDTVNIKAENVNVASPTS